MTLSAWTGRMTHFGSVLGPKILLQGTYFKTSITKASYLASLPNKATQMYLKKKYFEYFTLVSLESL